MVQEHQHYKVINVQGFEFTMDSTSVGAEFIVGHYELIMGHTSTYVNDLHMMMTNE